MKESTRNIIKKVALSVAGVMAFLFLAIVIVVNCVLTNDRLMPIIKGYAHEYLDAEVEIGEASGSFFNSFPYVGVRLDSVTIVTNAFHGGPRALTDSTVIADSLRLRVDTLARVDRVIVGLNLVEYLLSDSDNIAIGLIKLDGPRVHLHTDKLGRNSWDIVRPSEETDTTSSSTSVTVHHIHITDGRIGYFSRPDQMGVFLDTLNLKADGDMGLDKFNAKLDLDILRTNFGIKDNRYIRRMPLGLEGELTYDTEQNKFLLNELCMRVASADINLDGWVMPGSSGATMDVKYELDTPKAEKLFAAIPESVVSTPVDIKDGAIGLKGSIVGRISDTEIPLIKGDAHLDNIHAQYKGMPDDIEDITAKFNMLIDQERPDSSYVNLDIFHFKGGESEVSAIVKVTQLLTDAMMDCQVKAHINFDNLLRVIPFDNTQMSGIVDADVTTHFSIDDIQRRNYGNAKLDGTIKAQDVCITNEASDFDIDINADLKMKTDQIIKLSSKLNKLDITAGSIKIHAKDGGFEAESAFAQDTTSVVPLRGKVSIDRLFFRSDTIAVFAKNIQTDDRIDPEEGNPRHPVINHDLKIDTVFAGVFGNRLFSHDLHVMAHQRVERDTAWHTSGTFEYAALSALPTFYQKPIKTSNFKLTMDGDSVNVNHVTVATGVNTLHASGYVNNFITSLRQRQQVTLNLNVDADTIDCNEIMASIITEKADSSLIAEASTSIGIDTTTTTIEAAADTLKGADPMMRHSAMILVPRHIKLSVSANAKAIKWNTLNLSNVTSKAQTKEGAALVNLTFNIGDAKSISILSYKAWPATGKARANVFSRWERTDIGFLSSALGLDSIIPALKPVQGKLDCYMAAELELDSAMNVVPATARASIHLGGQQLTLMDNDSFRKIGKKLMFKNKDRNVIDTLSMNVLLDSGKVQVLPFVVNIDRYRMACAGHQDLDMNMNYHISILKSPLPFKAGVTIKGTPEDFDVDITTAKLKKLVDAESMAKNDTLSLLMRMSVLRNGYILAGQPLPEQIRRMKGLDNANSRFAIAIQEDSDTEESIREAEMARRAAAAGDTTVVTADTIATGITVPTDSIQTTIEPK